MIADRQHSPAQLSDSSVKYRTILRFTMPCGLILLLVLSGCSRETSESSADGEYANTAPGVKYVGSEKCASCHVEIYQSYRQAEMGRSMSKLDPKNVVEQFPSKGASPQRGTVYDSVGNYYYEMVKRGDRFFQREYRVDKRGNVVHERWMEAEYVIGSGNNLRMYFHNENGMLYELPLIWYVHEKRWDLSPGYREFGNLRFSRFATARCVSCHNSYLEQSPTANDRFVEPFPLGIGCERCHGPGELHVEQMAAAQTAEDLQGPRTIVNPRKLPPERQLDVCRQCHLQGKAWALHGESDWFDYRPGKPLSTHRSVYFPATTPKEVFEVADSPHRLSLSRCFVESDGQLTCITCHDPHRSIKTFTIDHYNLKCLQCHAPTSLPGEKSRHQHRGEENCISCHMNRTGTDNTLHGVSNTDHWIRVDANKARIDWSLLKTPPSRQPLISLVPDVDAKDDGADLRKGVAYLDYYRQHDRRRAYLDSALTYLSSALSRKHNDARALFHVGEVRIELGQYPEAVSSLGMAAALQPTFADAYAKMGRAYYSMGDYEMAITSYRQALVEKPDEPSYLEGLGIALADAGHSQKAAETLERALEIDRQSPYAFYYLGNIYGQQLRQPQKAVGFYQKLVILDHDFPNGYMNLGNTYGVLGEYSNALKAYELELAVRPRSALTYFNMGRVYTMMGKRSAARDAFRTVLELDSTMALAKRELEELEKQ